MLPPWAPLVISVAGIAAIGVASVIAPRVRARQARTLWDAAGQPETNVGRAIIAVVGLVAICAGLWFHSL